MEREVEDTPGRQDGAALDEVLNLATLSTSHA